jgi:putative DNA primase/helicase
MTEADEPPKFLLLCPTCKKPVKEHHTDDIQTWYICENGHQTAAPIRQEIDGITEFQMKFCEALEEHPEALTNYEPPEVAPPFSWFCGKNGKFIPKLLADDIMSKYTFATMMDNEETYVYMDGFYQSLGDVLIKKAVKERLQDEYHKNRAIEVIDYIKASTYTTRREEPPNLLLLDNGVLDLSKDPFELKPHSPKYMFFNKIPIKYDPEADCPNIKKFMREITNSEEDVIILEETLGFCLYREYLIAKALMLVGDGSNGKSTFLNLAKTFLGHKNVSGRSLQDLELHRFAKADLHSKLANIYADLSDKALQSTGTFKMLTGRDLISAEKKFQHTFHFANYAKLMFSANKVPEANDDSSAFFRRWIIIVFPKAFTGSNADPYILEKLTTEIELSGLLNLALAGLKRLLKTGQFSHSKTTEEVKEDYVRKSSPTAAFLMDCIETDSDAFIEKKSLYIVFAEYCRNLKLPTVTQDTFFKNLPKYAAVADYKPTIKGTRFYTFKGLRYGLNASNLSTQSRVFYTLIEKSDLFRNNGYKVTTLPGMNFIKIEIPLDSLDRVDDQDHESHKLSSSPSSLKEKLEEIKNWIVANKDSDGLVDSEALAKKCTEIDVDVQSTIKILLDEYQIFKVPVMGKWGVK